MKRLLLPIIAFTFLFGKIYAQNKMLQKTWVGDNLEFLEIDSQKVYFEVFGNFPVQETYLISKDTLRLVNHSRVLVNSSWRPRIKIYDFQILEKTDRHCN